ncbi:diguanylate cyclase [Paenibacillus sp. ATY16]|uniref:histidine kinase N-terminal 7TM domain-containing diguanylate cyclase n=1 Tax=Paenibacillus sp. ATY16 TaxID=1759312 RepID=UPI00200D6C2C|nr:diguanylate cyclase [Paenibacillus sp. ATY16]MCK9857002.1 diguanylate cyclase [Paenibacillus sp. ATY16]
MMWLDFSMFLVLLGLFFYVFAVGTITVLHKIYFALHLVLMVWPLTQFIAQTMPGSPYRLFYLLASYSGLSLVGVGWFIFVVFMTGQAQLIRTRRLIMLSVPALISVAFVVVNPDRLFLSINEQLTDKQLQSGPLYWYMIVQLFSYILVSLVIIGYTLRRGVSVRQQMLVRTAMNGVFVLVLFGLGDFFVNIVLINYFSSYFSIFSVGITLSAVYLVHAITRHRVFDIIQIVQRDVMNTISTGIIVLDESGVVLEFNKAMKPILKLKIGERFSPEALAVHLPKSLRKQFNQFLQEQKLWPMERQELEISLHNNGHYRYIVVQAAPILSQKKKELLGRLLTFHDVTELRLLVDETNTQNELLQDRNRELLIMQDELFQANKKLEHMAITDGLTGCYNRRYLLQQLEHEIAVNVQYGIPFSIFLFDIDLFKAINDQYGHLVGDEVICSTVEAVKNTLRSADILARYGGEEFTVYLPHTTRDQADIIADMVKESVEQNVVRTGLGSQSVRVTISMGVVSVEQFDKRALDDPKAFLRELLAQADAALYEAKYSGRNRIVKRKLA